MAFLEQPLRDRFCRDLVGRCENNEALKVPRNATESLNTICPGNRIRKL